MPWRPPPALKDGHARGGAGTTDSSADERYRPTLFARDVMTTPVKSIVEDATITEAERAMTTYGVNVLPVVDRKINIIGIISRETIQKALFHHLDQLVGDVSSSGHYSAHPETPFHDIETRMMGIESAVSCQCCPMANGGVITRTDLLAAFMTMCLHLRAANQNH